MHSAKDALGCSGDSTIRSSGVFSELSATVLIFFLIYLWQAIYIRCVKLMTAVD